MKYKFDEIQSREELYQKIMEIGKELPPFDEAWTIPENLVSGCQSILYLHSEVKEGKIYFYASSDALISKGLAALLIDFYSGRPPEEVLKVAPTFLEELKIPEALSPSRANGLASLYLKMKQQALSHLVAR